MAQSSADAFASRTIALSFCAGIVLGALAGLIGVGGSEFRIPVLLCLLRKDVKGAAAANLIVGLITVILSLIRRWHDALLVHHGPVKQWR